jgi:renin receptor
MFKYILLISTYILAVNCAGQLTILNAPKSLEFKNAGILNTDSVSDIFGVALGYPIEHSSDWKGMYVRDPFNVAESILTVYVDGIDKLISNKMSKSSHSYELYGSSISESLDKVTLAIEEHNSETIDFDLNQGLDFEQYTTILGDAKFEEPKQTLNLKPQVHPEDKLFLEQIATIKSLAESLATLETVPTLITVRLSLTSFISAHKDKSPAAIADAISLLNNAIEELKISAVKAFHSNVLVTVVADKEDIVYREKRAAEATPKQSPQVIPDDINLALDYNSDYPVIFNIILWFGVVMVFSLLAISYAIASMDPGRDSVIYRMTSTRMKKDN